MRQLVVGRKQRELVVLKGGRVERQSVGTLKQQRAQRPVEGGC